MKKTVNVIIRGFLYIENWIPNSSQRNIYKPYTQDFRIVEDKYRQLFDILKKKYNLEITFCSYTSTPKYIIDYIKNKQYNLHLIPFNKKYQFNHVYSFLENNKYNPTIILRSDLILSDIFIKKLSEIDYHKLNKIIVLAREPNDKIVDIMFIIPVKFIDDMRIALFNKRDGHFIDRSNYIKNNIMLMENECFVSFKENKYYEIRRREKK